MPVRSKLRAGYEVQNIQPDKADSSSEEIKQVRVEVCLS